MPRHLEQVDFGRSFAARQSQVRGFYAAATAAAAAATLAAPLLLLLPVAGVAFLGCQLGPRRSLAGVSRCEKVARERAFQRASQGFERLAHLASRHL